jgi:hypothetical protein
LALPLLQDYECLANPQDPASCWTTPDANSARQLYPSRVSAPLATLRCGSTAGKWPAGAGATGYAAPNSWCSTLCTSDGAHTVVNGAYCALSTGWTAVAAGPGSDGGYVLARMAPGQQDPECLVAPGTQKCMSIPTPTVPSRQSLPGPEAVLQCGFMAQKILGSTGYENSGTWCSGERGDRRGARRL